MNDETNESLVSGLCIQPGVGRLDVDARYIAIGNIFKFALKNYFKICLNFFLTNDKLWAVFASLV